MRSISASQFRKTLAATLNRVNADREPVIITRDRGRPVAVLLSADEYSKCDASMHLLRSPANTLRLQASIAEFIED